MTSTDGPTWGDAGFTPDVDVHAVEPQAYADVYCHDDGTATFDEGWRAAYIETDTLVDLEDWR